MEATSPHFWTSSRHLGEMSPPPPPRKKKKQIVKSRKEKEKRCQFKDVEPLNKREARGDDPELWGLPAEAQANPRVGGEGGSCQEGERSISRRRERRRKALVGADPNASAETRVGVEENCASEIEEKKGRRHKSWVAECARTET